LIPVRAESLDCRDTSQPVLSLAGSGGGHAVMLLVVSPE
jgi:hypothetical protein